MIHRQSSSRRDVKKHFVTGLAALAVALTLLIAACGSPARTSSPTPFGLSPTTAVPGAATRLVFTTEPAGAAAGVPFSPAPVVAVQNSSGQTVTGFDGPVALSFTVNQPGVKLYGTTTVNAVNGIATFPDISIDAVGTYYSFTAASTGLASAVSNTFSITPGAAKSLVFVVEPVAGGAGAAFTTQPIVAVEDAYGNVVTDSDASVTITIRPGTGTSGAQLTGKNTVAVDSGFATFTYLAIDTPGNNYVLIAASPGLTSAYSVDFYVNKATATS